MFEDLIYRLNKTLRLVPLKYWNGLALAFIALLSWEIGSSITNPPSIPLPQTDPVKPEPLKPQITLKKTKVPASIGKGNIFRQQRKDFKVPPPPPPPKKKPVVEKELRKPQVKLLGVIITDNSRIAILNGDIKKFKKDWVHKDEAISGARTFGDTRYTGKPDKDGNYYKLTPLKTDKLKNQSFYEGDLISDYILDRVLEDRIEMVHLGTGDKEIVFLEMKVEKAPARQPRKKQKAKPVNKKKGGFPISGARTKR